MTPRNARLATSVVATPLVVFMLCLLGCAPATEWYAGTPQEEHKSADTNPVIVEPPTWETSTSDTSSVDPLKQKILLLPFRDLSNHRGPWEINTQFARGLGDSLRKYDFLHVIPVDAVLQHLSEKELEGQFGKARAIQLARLAGADISVMAEIEALAMSRFQATVPLGGYRSYQGISTVNAFLINEVDGREMGEARADALNDSRRTGIVNPALHVPLDREYAFLGDAPWGSEQFHTTLVGKAVSQCLQELAQKVSELIRPSPAFDVSDPLIVAIEVEIEGVVAYINVGSAEGVKNGNKFGVYDHGRELKDPHTGTVLGIGLPSRVGVVQIEQVLNTHLSKVRVLDGAEKVKKGFSIRAE